MKKRGMSFKIAYLSAGILPMLIGVIVMAVTLTSSLKTQIKEGIQNELMVSATQLEEYFESDIAAGGDVNYDEYSDHVYIESLQDDGVELTLFKDDTRLITSLKNSDGSYNEGTQAASDIYAAVKAGSDYSAENVAINGKNYFVYYTPIKDADGNFWGMAFAGKTEDSVNTTIRQVVINIIVLSVILAIVLAAIILVLAQKLSKNLAVTAGNINRLSEGDLEGAEFNNSSFVQEFNSIVEAGDALQKQLLTSVGGAKSTSADLGEAVNVVDGLSASSADGTTQIAQAVNELATTAQSMAETVQDANSTVVDMGDSIDRISQNVSDMNRASEASMEANKTAMEYMAKLAQASEKSARTVDEISEKIADCSASAEKINAATDAITSISSQTNLLSLNASIEAARAGEAGRGFAVVAGEIQKLAEQSSSSANEIQDVIREILSRVNECVDKAGEMTEVIKEQMSFLTETKEKIDAMSDTGKDLASGAAEIDKEAVTLMELKEKVLSSISDLSAISEENAASSEEVNASVESIASAVESTKEESAIMRQFAEELSDKMAFFKM